MDSLIRNLQRKGLTDEDVVRIFRWAENEILERDIRSSPSHLECSSEQVHLLICCCAWHGDEGFRPPTRRERVICASSDPSQEDSCALCGECRGDIW